MNAFGRKNGMNGSAAPRASVGVARPMKGAEPLRTQPPMPPLMEDQFPAPPVNASGPEDEALARLAERAAQQVAGEALVEGFEASVHRIKEQVLPRLLERVLTQQHHLLAN